MGKSYFTILGISSDATAEEIRSAYRRLAKAFHPDHFTGGGEKFREIQEAYTVLGDTEKRHAYEMHTRKKSNPSSHRPPHHPEPEPLIPEDRPVDLGKISSVNSFESFTPSLNEILDWFQGNFSHSNKPKSGRVQNLTLEVILTPEQVRRGGFARIAVPPQPLCPTCHGHAGSGFQECPRCAGYGTISGEIPIQVSFPPGLTRDHTVLIPLDRYGIRNTRMTVLFRPTGIDPF